jgi:hypothetical protein
MSDEVGILELGSYKLKFDRNIFSGFVLKQSLPSVIYINKKMDAKNIAVISICNYDAAKVGLSYILSHIDREFGITNIVANPMLVNEKLGDNVWHVCRITAGKLSHINLWILKLDDEFMVQVMAIFSNTEDPIYSQIREMIAGIEIETP